jgi:hypothetical protein
VNQFVSIVTELCDLIPDLLRLIAQFAGVGGIVLPPHAPLPFCCFCFATAAILLPFIVTVCMIARDGRIKR